ncbi:MAG: hypothetical protein QG661_1310 [Actinomycetota bacterium]|nr:hypothetical protein [Actinomycetota bacterium]
MTPIKKTFQYGQHTVTLETGEIARQASGAVIVNMDDTVVLATGYRPHVHDFLDAPAAHDGDGTPRTSGHEAGVPGLYFCGYYVSPTGMLREIGLEARRIAASIATTAPSLPAS